MIGTSLKLGDMRAIVAKLGTIEQVCNNAACRFTLPLAAPCRRLDLT
jgi:hypothetical protein